MKINSYESNKHTYVALNLNTFVRFKPNAKGLKLIGQSQVHADEFDIDEDGFFRCPMHLFVQAFGADIGCSNAYLKGNTFAVCIDTAIVVDESTEPLACDLCGYNFEDQRDYNNLYHFSGTLDGKENNHIHACANCVEAHNLNKVDIDLRQG